MNDLIKGLAEVSLYLCNEAGREDYSDTVEQASDELAKQRWISVEEKLPEERESFFARFKGTDKWSNVMYEKISEDVRVVVVLEDGTRRVHHSYTVDGKWDIEKKPPKRTVTHWMPNPELPAK